MRSKTYHLSPQAIHDLENIWYHTFTHWGLDQANAYVDELDQTFKELCDKPDFGQSVEYIRPNYRRVIIASHAIYYTIQTSGVQIMRILHGRMNPTRHL